MANNLTNDAENLILNWICAVSSPTPNRPTDLKVRLYNTISDQETATGTPVTGGNYLDQSVTFVAAGTSPYTAGQTANSADIVFGGTTGATSAWGTIRYVGIIGTVGGVETPLWIGELSAYKDVQVNDVFRIPQGQLILSLN